MGNSCNEPNCTKGLFKSLRAKCLTLHDMLANIYCALMAIKCAIVDAFNYYVVESKILRYAFHYEIWSYNQKLEVGIRPADFVPFTGKITHIDFTFPGEMPTSPGSNPISFNLIVGGVVIGSYVNSLPIYSKDFNLAVTKGQLIQIQITDAPDIPSDDANWYGLGAYIFFTKS